MVRQMLKPRILGGTVPMLHTFGNLNHHARFQLHRFLAPFLIPAATGNTNEHLHLFVMDVNVAILLITLPIILNKVFHKLRVAEIDEACVLLV